MPGVVEGIYVAPEGGAPPELVVGAEAIEGRGLEGDRYCSGKGHWSRFGRDCQVTFVEAEDLEEIEAQWGLRVANGEHRRNVVTRGVRLEELRRTRFRVGGELFGYGKPCSVCRHVERLTEPGMTQALKGRGGMCARVLEGGRIRSRRRHRRQLALRLSAPVRTSPTRDKGVPSMSEGFISRGFRDRRRQPERDERVPPGQYLVDGFPVLSAGSTPRTALKERVFAVVGEIDEPQRWSCP